VVKEDVPEGSLSVSQNEQRNIDGYAERKAAEAKEEDNS
jgi:bifunctional N-acetylglucosamine-1-phosphate-uridyltransferase/glucosamine-1-phosphate-acetyltransferase GlmU-like protein